MHEPFMNGLEDYLSGKRQTDAFVRLRAHLEQCAECRQAASALEEHSRMLGLLRTEESVEPAPGFYARVMDRIEAQAAGSLWSPFLEPMFAKRLMFASMMLLVVFFSAAVSVTNQPAIHEALPYELVAESATTSGLNADPANDRAVVFSNLASYTGASLLVTSNE